MEKVTAQSLRNSLKDIRWKKRPTISMLTAYDYSLARILDQTDLDIILVGDSLGNVILGYEDTLPVTMEDMVHHTKAVSRAVKRALLVADMPAGSMSKPVENARKLITAGAEAVKVEGVKELEGIKEILAAGIPVMGHVGFLPQSVKEIGGYKVQRSTKIIDDAVQLEKAGVFAVVIEMADEAIARQVTAAVNIPVISCGAGNGCDGQVLVTYDLLGLSEKAPKFAKKSVDLSAMIKQAVNSFIGK